MKILIDLTKLYDKITGMERFASQITYHLIKSADESKCNITFILVFRDTVYELFEEFRGDKNVEFVILPNRNSIFFNLFSLPFSLYKIKADRYYFPAYPVPILLFKKNMICTIHDLSCWDCPETMNLKYRFFFKLSLRLSILKCKYVTAVSNFTKNRISDFFRINGNRICVVYNGVADCFYNFISQDERNRVREKYKLPENYILTLSTIMPRKNTRLLLEAYNQLNRENKTDIPLVLVGRNDLKEEPSTNINQDQIKKIQYTGYVDNEDLPSIYSMANLFVFPSKYEGFGIPPLEALASGTQVLSSDAPCMPEILEDAALYFKSDDVDDLKQKLSNLVTNKNCKSKDLLIKQARKYSWSQESKKLLDFLMKSRLE